MRFENRNDIERVELLEEAVRDFANFFSSDDSRHWQLYSLPDNEDFEKKDWME